MKHVLQKSNQSDDQIITKNRGYWGYEEVESSDAKLVTGAGDGGGCGGGCGGCGCGAASGDSDSDSSDCAVAISDSDDDGITTVTIVGQIPSDPDPDFDAAVADTILDLAVGGIGGVVGLIALAIDVLGNPPASGATPAMADVDAMGNPVGTTIGMDNGG
jgi:hypothetical protein